MIKYFAIQINFPPSVNPRKPVKVSFPTFTGFRGFDIICFFLFSPLAVVQRPLHLHARKALLAQRLVQHDADTICQIQAPDLVEHGNPDTGLFIIHQKLLGNPRALPAKHDKIIPAKRCLCVYFPRLCRRHPEPRAGISREIFFNKFPEIHVPSHIEVLPVVHASPAQLLSCQAEPERLDQMKRRPRRDTGAAYVSSVCRNLRLIQYDVHACFSRPTKRSSLAIAFFRFSREYAYEMRRKPSPLSPNALPGTTASFSSCRRREANSSLVMPNCFTHGNM